jgi:hypothetical protein
MVRPIAAISDAPCQPPAGRLEGAEKPSIAIGIPRSTPPAPGSRQPPGSGAADARRITLPRPGPSAQEPFKGRSNAPHPKICTPRIGAVRLKAKGGSTHFRLEPRPAPAAPITWPVSTAMAGASPVRCTRLASNPGSQFKRLSKNSEFVILCIFLHQIVGRRWTNRRPEASMKPSRRQPD